VEEIEWKKKMQFSWSQSFRLRVRTYIELHSMILVTFLGETLLVAFKEEALASTKSIQIAFNGIQLFVLFINYSITEEGSKFYLDISRHF
jgi:hypothetical protein